MGGSTVGCIGKATRYASTHAKLGISKNGIVQPAICIEAGVAYNTGSSYVGEGNNNTYLMNLPYAIRRDLKIALLCGFNSDTKSSPVANTNLDDFWFATQVVSWEIHQGLRTGYGKSDLAVNSSIPNTPKTAYYDQLKGRPAEKCYEYILNKMKAYSLVPSFTGRAKATAPTHTMKYDSSTKKYSIIAAHCGIKSTQTVSKITDSLMRKGYITHILAAYRKDNRKGTYP